jgi:hypothetical protein
MNFRYYCLLPLPLYAIFIQLQRSREGGKKSRSKKLDSGSYRGNKEQIAHEGNKSLVVERDQAQIKHETHRMASELTGQSCRVRKAE